MEGTQEKKLSLKNIETDLLYGLLDNPYESLILVDRDGIVRFMSSANEGMYPVNIKEAIGRSIQNPPPKKSQCIFSVDQSNFLKKIVIDSFKNMKFLNYC